MLSEVLRWALNERITTLKELGAIAGVSDSAVSRYHTDQAQPLFDTIRQWVRHHPSRELRLALAQCLINNTPIRLLYADDPLDGDGRVDGRDAVRRMHHALSHLAEQLQRLDDALDDGRVSDGELIALQEEGRQVIAGVYASLDVLATLNEQQRHVKARRGQPCER